MREIFIRKLAKENVYKLMQWIDKDDSTAADNLTRVFEKTVNTIAEFPEMGRNCGDRVKVYKFLMGDYNTWILYTFSDASIDILNILHTSMDFESNL